ncbi:MAG: hypothetical protein CO156_05415 [Candidatus Pacebacteria bacterium CG_4_9_14_3_um_filter_40_12]|nr:hypothetical protein [Candidatus Paceibacterota bacterium]PIR63641.1 MAG: hypothetical protein COU64_03530 [Candidatus Pacebacteria bacterium CG10_big_fil_rev_8_21_14_0_10_40_26]PIZ78743.1 MAG: hypothetical protein COY01_03900 [Candidatus Pacebacteria bacterium CG_4_10_14_0_2_um_filter_40_20]PJA68405.1 MAG: hypothetical protein CO156_05415 [Candidatus Pacebacteria bacterium CG_4_9_14_3_um_filter_40_12]PJC41267.1 MAG: hypothetical protein CO041_05485 [Candidatus Pacebacteria bacterium CG_4_9_
MIEQREQQPFPLQYENVTDDELALSTSNIMDLLDKALRGVKGPDGKTLEEFSAAVEAEKKRKADEVAYAPIKERAEKEWQIRALEKASEAMITRAMELLKRKNVSELIFQEFDRDNQPRKESLKIIKLRAGDMPEIRFKYNSGNEELDIVLSLDTDKKIIFRQYYLADTLWRKVPTSPGNSIDDTQFRGENLLAVASELSALSQALETLVDFSSDLTPTLE